MNNITSEHLQGLMVMLQAENEVTEMIIEMIQSGQITINVVEN